MTDRKMIYLDDAIDALEREKTYSAVYKYGYTQTDYFKQYNMGLTDAIKALNKLPSAQPIEEVKRMMTTEQQRRKTICVAKGQDPYNVIGNYICEHLTVIEDMIAVIRINDAITNELFLVDWGEEGCFVWHHDWWEGEENVELIDFFPVSDSERSQTLYGYKIENLAYIAKVMEKEGVTAEYAARTFDDMSRAIRMILDETQQKVEEVTKRGYKVVHVSTDSIKVVNAVDEPKSACSDCQEFDCYGCKYKEKKE